MLIAYLFFSTSINSLQNSLITLNKTNYVVNLLLKTSRENRNILYSKDKSDIIQLEEINNAVLIINNELLEVLDDENKQKSIKNINVEIKKLTTYYYAYNSYINKNRELIEKLKYSLKKIKKTFKKINRSIQRDTINNAGNSAYKEQITIQLTNLFAINRLSDMVAVIENNIFELNQSYNAEQKDKILDYVKSAKEYIEFISKNITIEKNKKLIENSITIFNSYENYINEFITNKFKETESNNNISNTLNIVSTSLTEVLQEIDSELYEEVENTNYLMIIILTIITVVVIALSLLLSKQINKSLHKIVQTLKVTGNDVKEYSHDLGDSSQKLMKVLEEQNSSVDDINRTIGITIGKIEENSKSTIEANELSSIINNSINNNHNQMKELTVSIDNINSSSNEIKNITKTIDDISFQINLLSLNAAVEAARAGEHGQGFAVVADEVKSLASKSSEALRQIDDIISSSIEYVDQGVTLTNNTYESFNDMVTQIKDISDLINKINLSSKEQINEVQHIKSSIDSIDSIRDSLISQSENTSNISEVIDKLSDDMLDVIAYTQETIGEDKKA
jgi:methyl-accepting chemotaxis protein/methyl-accepting chemotaxis protein-2 (aspartate sensor receptor)